MSCCTLQNSAGRMCPSIMEIAKRAILVPELDGSGAKNKLANVAAVTKSALQAKFDAADINDRWFPLELFENVEDLREDAIRETFNGGRSVKVRDGKRSFTAIMPLQDSYYLDKLKALECKKFGVYFIDEASNFIYSTDASTKLEVLPIMIANGSLSFELVKATNSEVIRIKVMFDFRLTEKDELIRYIDAADLDFDGLGTDVYGLLDAKHTVASESTTGWVSTITENTYGDPIEGLVLADFSLYNDTQSASVSITSVTEGSAGVYTFVIPTQLSADSMTLSMTKSGYADELIESVKVVVP